MVLQKNDSPPITPRVQPPPIRPSSPGPARKVSDLEFDQMLRTLKYAPNPLEDEGGREWSPEELRRLHDAVLDNRT